MSLAEGVSARIAYKPYATGAITSNVEPTSASDPGASGGQILRRVGSTLKLGKDTYQSAEIRADRQIGDMRHGTRRVTGGVSGELSCNTYSDLFEALFRGTWAAGVSLDPSDLTSIAADNGTSTFTAAAGAPVTLGLRVGDIIRFASLADTDNNAKNFLITGFSGTSNRVIAVYPAPDTMSPDTSFTLTSFPRLIAPSSGHASRKFAFEVYNEDIDVARLFTECRIGSARLQLPATGMTTVEFGVMGRNLETYSASAAPFFTSPSAATTTGLLAAVNGFLRMNATQQAVVTGIDLNIDLAPSSDAVVGQDIVPEIFLGRFNVSGTVTAFFESLDLLNAFLNESEIELMVKLDATSAANTPCMTLYAPRIKLGDFDAPAQGEGGQSVTIPFSCLKYEGAGAGIDQTTLAMVDTEVTP